MMESDSASSGAFAQRSPVILRSRSVPPSSCVRAAFPRHPAFAQQSPVILRSRSIPLSSCVRAANRRIHARAALDPAIPSGAAG